MNYKTILALDPSGSFYEGKGTTGWCLYDCVRQRIRLAGSIFAKEYTNMCAYWQAQLDLIDSYNSTDYLVVCEDYLLYAHKAVEQTNSRMETPKVIGCIQLHCWQKKIPLYMQTAGEVKTRWNNDVLLHKELIVKQGRSFVPNCTANLQATHHSLDAVRHAMHYATFKNKEKQTWTYHGTHLM